MKTTPILIAVGITLLPACAGPAERHYAREDRRYDRRERVLTGNVGAEDRREDRYDRVSTRYGNYNY